MTIEDAASRQQNLSEKPAALLGAHRPARPGQGWRRALFAAPGPDNGLALPWRALLMDWAILAAVVLAFCAAFLDLDDARALPGNEADIVQALDWTLVNSLNRFGQFPLWNPYLRTGIPYIADPFLHVYNPLATAPVLLFGVWDGFKIALYFSFLVAALGMWQLGAVLGAGRPARLWMGLMYAFTGQGVARFFQGEYDFVLGFGWIPWVLALTLLAVRTRQWRHALAAAVALALLFFSGNVYYAFYMIFVLPLLALVSALEVDWRGCLGRVKKQVPAPVRDPRKAAPSEPGQSGPLSFDKPLVRWRGQAFAIVVVVVLLAVGLTAIQWLPMLDYWKSYTKMPDPQLVGSHSLSQIWLDYVSPDHNRPDARKTLPPEEFYAYTGVWPFLLLVFLPPAYRRGRRREQVFLMLLLVLAVAYIATKYMPWAQLYKTSPLLNQFRYQTRMLIYGAVALIGLAGGGLDAIWARVAAPARLNPVSVPALARWTVARAGAALLIAFMLWSVADVYRANRRPLQVRDRYQPHYELIEWLRQSDPAVYYVSTGQGNWHGALISNEIRYLDAWYGLEPILPTQGATNARPVRARPKYMALGNDQAPDQPHELVRRFAQHSLWRLPGSLPYIFVVSNARLMDPARGAELTAAEVRPLEPAAATPNRIAVQAEAGEDETLVVLTGAYHGWRVTVDGRPAALRNVGGYLAVSLQGGRHRYEFTFSPTSFWVGLGVSAATIAGLAAGAAARARFKRRRFRAQAVYAQGAVRLAQPLDLADETPVRVTVEPIERSARRPGAPTAARAGDDAPWLSRFSTILFILSLAVYLFTRLWQIDRFPINFFADEATFTLLAEDLLTRGLRDGRGTFLPVYFEVAANRWTPVLAVYMHLPALVMFGKSIVATRAASALVTLLVPLAVSLALRFVFRARYWWAAALVVAVVPTWFMHSRTAFEWLTMASCYAGFILCYLLYRVRSPRFLYAAILCGAAAFYNHASGQLVMAASVLLLGLSDLRYHLRNWRTILWGLLLAAFLALPFLRLQAAQPDALVKHLRVINSYWFQDISLADKLQRFAGIYLYGLSPHYWFFPNSHDLERHRMLGYGNLGWVLAPAVLAGLVVGGRRIRSAPYRAVLLAAVAAPAGAATAEVAITRMMAFIPPICLIAGLGLDWLLEKAAEAIQAARARTDESGWTTQAVYRALAVVTWCVLSGVSLGMLRDALTNGPTWFTDYTMYGMQYGARELFGEAIPHYLKQNPTATLVVSPNWANGTDAFVRFFLPPDQQFSRVQMHDIRYFIERRRALTPDMVLVAPANEYVQAKTNPKFAHVAVKQMIPYPDGRPGFYFFTLAYADDLDQILERERQERARPVVETLDLNGQRVQISHSQFDMGQLRDVFDGDNFSLARGLEANPLVFDFIFPQPRPLGGLSVSMGTMAYKITALLYAASAAQPVVYEQTSPTSRPDPVADFAFDRGPATVTRLRLEILHLNAGEEVHIHVREIVLK